MLRVIFLGLFTILFLSTGCIQTFTSIADKANGLTGSSMGSSSNRSKSNKEDNKYTKLAETKLENAKMYMDDNSLKTARKALSKAEKYYSKISMPGRNTSRAKAIELSIIKLDKELSKKEITANIH